MPVHLPRFVCAVLLLVLAPLLRADTQRAIAALNTGDYVTAWREFTESAERGDAEAQAGVGAMLFDGLNPAGTGIFADCERWLTTAAAQGNVKGMTYLGKFHYAQGTRLIRTADAVRTPQSASTATRQAATLRFMQARQWFERAAARGGVAAMADLATMLDAGAGGPRDAARAARLRAQARPASDAAGSATVAFPAHHAMIAAWQAGRYAEVVAAAQPLAEAGDGDAQALLGRAYYEGVGLPRDYNWAFVWLLRAAAQGRADAMFFLGLMHEHGRGVRQDAARALALLTQAAAAGQSHAAREAAGMRIQGGAVRPNPSTEQNACYGAGGSPTPGMCVKAGVNIDPYGPPM